ncbi:MAG: type II toxin-antitoxin system VapC family toxin [Planktothrix sp.]
MNERLLIDTDVLIDYLRANSQSVDFLENLTQLLLISSITVAELYAGVREGKERTALNNFISVFEVVPIDEKIATLGGLYRRDYGKSHGVGLADALIAATANIKQAKLVTLNQKHFPMLTDLIIPYKKG